MSRKSKIKNTAETRESEHECSSCIEALSKCVHESNPLTRAMLKEKAVSICKICSSYNSINSKKK